MSGSPLRAMTYNVRLDTDEDGEHAWPHRADAVASTVRFHRPAVVGLQEPKANQLRDLCERLPNYTFVGEPRDGEDGEHTPVGFRSERFDCVDHDTFWLSETPDDVGSVGWDGSHPRIATWAVLEDAASDTRFVHVNTHLDHEGETARLEGARLVRERAADLREHGPVVLTGDCNCEPGEPAYDALTAEASPFRDVRDVSPHAPHGPRTSFTEFDSLVEDMLIDHVFVTGAFDAEQCGTATDHDDAGHYPSDHLPVVANLRLDESS
ncbi:endonuclease/exonuclease/phosphatase family protein [Halospeciosus flavus]|uniref:Endonuclease/exonuclease/phosphatase family protein n=1 Tax=Halospeciosus flavus TaxID=3032283 RepID=A0ABD5Z445_9EURY|nr:endonuclease/exonuclease/phosphatase family protein [Halospeciosus flavus]